MNVTNTIQPFEIDGQDTMNVHEQRRLVVASHWVQTDRVHLQFEGKDIVVSADLLVKAVQNATNHQAR